MRISSIFWYNPTKRFDLICGYSTQATWEWMYQITCKWSNFARSIVQGKRFDIYSERLTTFYSDNKIFVPSTSQEKNKML